MTASRFTDVRVNHTTHRVASRGAASQSYGGKRPPHPASRKEPFALRPQWLSQLRPALREEGRRRLALAAHDRLPTRALALGERSVPGRAIRLIDDLHG